MSEFEEVVVLDPSLLPGLIYRGCPVLLESSGYRGIYVGPATGLRAPVFVPELMEAQAPQVLDLRIVLRAPSDTNRAVFDHVTRVYNRCLGKVLRWEARDRREIHWSERANTPHSEGLERSLGFDFEHHTDGTMMERARSLGRAIRALSPSYWEAYNRHEGIEGGAS